MKKYMAFVMAIFAMLIAGSFSGISAPADYSFSWTDPAGDVTIPDIDITQVNSHLEGSDVVIELVVAGNINTSSDYYTYFVKITSDPTATSDYDVPTCYITYSGGTSMLMTATGYSTVNATISPHTLTFRLPTSTFQEFPAYYLESASAQYSTSAIDMVVPDYGGGGSSGGSGGGSSGSTVDPATETPTDTSISVKITEVKVNVNKVDNGQNWHYVVTVKGTTSGVDHVSLSFVIYYTDGTKDISGWMGGPWTVPSGTYPGGMTVNKLSFNATSENWNTWELNADVKTPVYMTSPENMNWTSSMTKDIKDLNKVRVYARAFADANETQWNQDYYEFTPSTTEDSLNYDSTSSGSSGGGSSGGGTPGFEAAAAIAALSIASLAYAYRRRR